MTLVPIIATEKMSCFSTKRSISKHTFFWKTDNMKADFKKKIRNYVDILRDIPSRKKNSQSDCVKGGRMMMLPHMYVRTDFLREKHHHHTVREFS